MVISNQYKFLFWNRGIGTEGLNLQHLKPSDVLSGDTFKYSDVFGVNKGLVLEEENGDKFFIYDHYCLNPSCKCDDVVLEFIKNADKAPSARDEFAVRLSLKNKKYKLLDTNGITRDKIDEIVKDTIKDGIDFLKVRYQQMKDAGKKVLQENKETPIIEVKPKRNELCSCGSGKKYKKCCGK